jgi:hypothetical protein
LLDLSRNALRRNLYENIIRTHKKNIQRMPGMSPAHPCQTDFPGGLLVLGKDL